MLPYKEVQEMVDRYSGTIIFKGKTPIYVNKVLNGEDNVPIFYYNLVGDPQMARHQIISHNEDLMEGPFYLGYINKVAIQTPEDGVNYVTAYASRVPKRQWKQGLNANVIELQPGLMNFNTMVTSATFRDMLMGKYPSLNRAKALMTPVIRQVAFNRQIMIGLGKCDTVELGYRGKIVGISNDGDKFKLGKEYKFLAELMEANGVAVW